MAALERWAATAACALGHSAIMGAMVRLVGAESPFAGVALNCPGYEMSGSGGAFGLMRCDLGRPLAALTTGFSFTALHHRAEPEASDNAAVGLAMRQARTCSELYCRFVTGAWRQVQPANKIHCIY